MRQQRLLHRLEREATRVAPAMECRVAVRAIDHRLLHRLPGGHCTDEYASPTQHATNFAETLLENSVIQMFEDFRHHNAVEKLVIERDGLDRANARLFPQSQFS